MSILLPQGLNEQGPEALSALEEALQGEKRQEVRQQTLQSLHLLQERLDHQVRLGADPESFKVLQALQDASEAAVELMESLN